MPDPSTLDAPSHSTRIDPRFRARRIAVRRDAGRRRLQRLADLAVLAAAGAGFLLALRSPLLDVDRIEVRAGARVGADQVRRAAAVPLGTQLVDLDLGGIGTRVAALPWVDEVQVGRDLDGTVSVSVTERTPVARLEQTGSAPLLVDGEGRVLGPAGADGPEGLVTVNGVGPVVEPGAWLGSEALGALRAARDSGRGPRARWRGCGSRPGGSWSASSPGAAPSASAT